MRYGVWTPLPHTIRPEPLMDAAIAESGTRLDAFTFRNDPPVRPAVS